MSIAVAVKNISINTHLYLPLRWLKRRIDVAELRAHHELIELYRSLLPRNSLCFDVGANIGAVSEGLLEVGSRVVAFEPNPTVWPELRARCGRHSDWTLVPTALGDHAAVALLGERKSHGQSSLTPDWQGEVVRTHFVPVITLDAAITTFGRPAYCKIDVEGYEEAVLHGLSEPIPLLSFEVHLDPRGIDKALSCLKLLRAFGPAVVNVTPAERATFLLQEWVPITDFIAQFPHELLALMTGPPYGDIWLRRMAH